MFPFETTQQVRLADADVFVGEKKPFKANEHIDNRSAKLLFDAWVDDITDTEKEVFLYISFSFYGSRRREAFWLRDLFSLRITLIPNSDNTYPMRQEYDFQAALSMLSKAFDIVNEQLDKSGLASHKKSFDYQMTQVLTYDLARAFKLWHEDEKNGFLGMHEMSPSEAIDYLPTVITHELPKLSESDYKEMFKDAKKIILCEISPAGNAYDIAKRMRYAIDSLEVNSKDVFYYAEAGENCIEFITPDGSDIVNAMDRHFNVIKHIWGSDPDGTTRYTKAYVGLIVSSLSFVTD